MAEPVQPFDLTAPPELPEPPEPQAVPGGWRGRFQAMTSPCEVLLEGVTQAQARALLQTAQAEARRIEQKFSRYRADSVVSRWQAQADVWHTLDEESALLIDFAAQCHALSGGLFDISSGVLRRAWTFDGSDRLPEPGAVEALRAHVGWHRIDWQRPRLRVPAGMELDLGGIGKEYAVDRVLGLLLQQAGQLGCVAPALLVNFGGDLAASGPRQDGSAWRVGIERPDAPQPADGAAAHSAGLLDLRVGGLATSGDARRFIHREGVRYGHILDPRTGWPVIGAPRSVTVAAPTCSEAGVLSTLAMLQGPHAEDWLAAQGVPHWVQREPGGPNPQGSTP
ncbi:FAD:protein FMN transferase [Sphaerotilus mobilis]|uniref:FAD:protein FMN transferase n=1 Tax=Sphaerotilus mobilis TaxID=47994 RepID=A0A4Q7LT97_9BURK|nr:FAD:protein FMN transferase [Sphaerotilus mobilis]RZS56989.1 thiamine biosynthesis lipoprotein [Sphaerotilus mobilis]